MCNFRVSVDGDWLCLKELADVHLEMEEVTMGEPEEEHDGRGENQEIRPEKKVGIVERVSFLKRGSLKSVLIS